MTWLIFLVPAFAVLAISWAVYRFKHPLGWEPPDPEEEPDWSRGPRIGPPRNPLTDPDAPRPPASPAPPPPRRHR